MLFPDRIYGLEHEYGVMNWRKSGSFQKTWSTNDKFMAKPIHDSVLDNKSRHRMWHINGSCSYVDTGDHPEHATAECRTVRDALLYAQAGDVLMNRIFSREGFGDNGLHLFKNNIAYSDGTQKYVSFGCHENYMMRNPQELLFTLAPLLITRQIIDGAGWWRKPIIESSPGSGQDIYLLSQRAMMMEHAINSGTIQNRAIINDRDNNDTGSTPRLHIICGDSNILEFACYLKMGAVALVLSLIEAGKIPFIPCYDPVSTMQRIAQTGDPFLPCVGERHKRDKSAFDIQAIYCEIAQREIVNGEFESEETEADLNRIARYWGRALNAIYRRDHEWMLGRFDHVTKKYLIDRELLRHRITDPLQMSTLPEDIDIMYHNITNPVLRERMNMKWADRRILTDQEIERALVESPSHTRAKIRSRFVAHAIEHHLSNLHIEWPRCGFLANPDACFPTNDPLSYETDDLDHFLSSQKTT